MTTLRFGRPIKSAKTAAALIPRNYATCWKIGIGLAPLTARLLPTTVRLVVFGTLCLAMTSPSLDADIVFSSGVRSIFANAVNNSNINTTAAGEFEQSVSASFSQFGIASSAAQDSMTPNLVGPSMSGLGTANYSINASGIGLVGAGSGSFFDVLFTVDADGLYELDAMVAWNGDYFPSVGIPFNFATVDLTSSSGSLFSISRTGATPGSTTASQTVFLHTGNSYHLVAQARILGSTSIPGSYGGTVTWEISLAPLTSVPEPATFWLVGFGFLSSLRRRRNVKSRKLF